MNESAITDLAWLAGRWRGDFFGQGPMEEAWLPPMAGSMTGTFRAAKEGRAFLFEMLLLEQTDDEGIALHLRHYDSGLEGWKAEADGPQTYPLREVAESRAVFDRGGDVFPQRQVYVRDGDALEVRLEGEQHGKPRTVAFSFSLVR